MMSNNPFFVQSADYSQGLNTLSQGLINFQQQREQQAQQEKQQQAIAGLAEAAKSGDKDAVADYLIQNPNISQGIQDNVYKQLGVKEEGQKQRITQDALELLSNPQNTENILLKRIEDGKDQGADTSHSEQELALYRQNPESYPSAVENFLIGTNPEAWKNYNTAKKEAAKMDLDERKLGFEQQKFYTNRNDKLNDQGGGFGSTSSMKDFKYYQNLKKNEPEAAQQFGRQKGYISKSGEELSVFQQKNLDNAQNTAIESESKANSYDDLATQFTNNSNDLGGGIFGSWKDGLKTATGNEDAVSSLRRAWIATKNKEAIQSLPPGSASDPDIKMAQGGFLSNDANPKEVASFLRGIAKIERYKSEYNNFKAEYISKKNDTRGLLKAWQKKNKKTQDKDETSIGKSKNYTTKSGTSFTVEG